MKPRNFADRAGFTAVELTVVLLIMSILAVASTLNFGNSTHRFRAEVAARGIVSAIETVRMNARMTSASRRIQFSLTNNDYTLVGVVNPDTPEQPNVVKLNGPVYEAILQSVDLGGDSELIFSGYGVPDSGGTIVITAGGTTKTISVDAASGKATIL